MKAFLPLLILTLITPLSQAQNGKNPYKALWAEVDSTELKGFPKSALEQVIAIQQRAKKEGNDSQQLRALLYQSKYALLLEEEAQTRIIQDFKDQYTSSEFPIKNILASYLGHMYWQYYKANRYQILNRTPLPNYQDSPFTTWDAKAFFQEIDRWLQLSLVYGESLQQIPIASISLLLDPQKETRAYRPSLFDLLAHTALSFYSSGETGIAQPADNFVLNDPDYLRVARDFTQLKIPDDDGINLQAKSLKIYQELIQFHLRSTNTQALAQVDSERLEFVYNHITQVPDKEDVYQLTLQKSIEQYPDEPACTQYQLLLAQSYVEQGHRYTPDGKDTYRWKLKEALGLCQEAIDQHPQSRAGLLCQNLANELKQASLGITMERFIPSQKTAKILVQYRNTDTLLIQAFPVQQKDINTLQNLYQRKDQLLHLKSLKASHHWEAPLVDEGDLQSHTMEIPIPALDNGKYIIFAQSKSDPEETFAFGSVQATNIAIAQQQYLDQIKMWVTDRNTGKPLAGAKAHIRYTLDYNESKHEVTLYSDENGKFLIPNKGRHWTYTSIDVSHKGESGSFGSFNFYPRKTQEPRTEFEGFAFTDRSIYRPGQPLYFKGILVQQQGTSSELIQEELVTATLFDPNGQELASLDLESNAYGSIAGEFILPTTGLTGSYSLEIRSVSGLLRDRHYFQVEEYKRPQFEVVFDTLATTPKVNDTVYIKGNALAYAGSVISDARVRYKVQRVVRLPRWSSWRYPEVVGNTQEIAHGETATNAHGTFTIPFKALPDPDVDPEGLPIFDYEIEATVTDLNGETHSSTTNIRLGYHSMIARLEVPHTIVKSQKEQQIGIETQNLNGKAIPAQGSIHLYKLKGPQRVLRNRPWQAPEYSAWDSEEFTELFPHEGYRDESSPQEWELGQQLWSSTFDTKKANSLTLPNTKRWPNGQYKVVLESSDPEGNRIQDEAYFELYDPEAKQVADQQVLTVHQDKENYHAGDEATLTFGSATELYVTAMIQTATKTYEEQFYLNKGVHTLTIPITEADYGGIQIQYAYTFYNSFEVGNLSLEVPYPSRDLQLEILSFRDKLLPGSSETWSLKLKGPQGESVAAELLAGMYDASLDAFTPHQWHFNPWANTRPYRYFNIAAPNSFGTRYFRNSNPTTPIPPAELTFDQIRWFGLDLGFSERARRQYLSRIRRNRYVDSYRESIAKGTIQGVVMDMDGTPLPGVNVMVKGTTTGTQTDFDGGFTLAAKPENTILFSYLGYQQLSYPLDKNNFVHIYLSEESMRLDEVVTVGYGKRVSPSPAAAEKIEIVEDESEVAEMVIASTEADQAFLAAPLTPSADKDNFEHIPVRKNLQETAFFFPQLHTDEQGQITFSFTTPEAMTRWKLQLLAHDKNLNTVLSHKDIITQKDLMVSPNLPRFFREGDHIVLSSKISNLSGQTLSGGATLQLLNAQNGADITQTLLGSTSSQTSFTVEPQGNTQVSWPLQIPEGLGAVEVKIIATSGNQSDGESHTLPVLSNRILVTESQTLWANGGQQKTFVLEKLRDNTSTTLRHHQLTLEVTPNPVWYAVEALPYLMEYPYECNEQTFSRYFANSLAAHLVQSNPRIKTVFDQWRDSGDFSSKLEENETLKAILVAETPWLRDAQSEAEQQKRMALLFDLNKMRHELEVSITKLQKNQMDNGAWPWFAGGRPNRFVTQHIVSGMGHLQQLGVSLGEKTTPIIEKALPYLDAAFVEEYQFVLDKKPKSRANYLSATVVHYLYMRSNFTDYAWSDSVDKALQFYKDQAQQHWGSLSLYSQAQLALALHRLGDSKTAGHILASLEEHSLYSEEMGRYWKNNSPSWYWYQAPIETQGLLIEAFSEIKGDTKMVDELKQWLLKQKQTQHWPTTKATTQAVYALLLQGTDWLETDNQLLVTVGGNPVAPKEGEVTEAGSGRWKTRWSAPEFTPEMAEVSLTNTGKSQAWGSLYWQYFEDLDKIESASTPLQLHKEMYHVKQEDSGENLAKIDSTNAVKIGDLVRVRIVLQVDRKMEFVHLKDMRAAGLEPVDVLSQYKWQEGLGYYQSTRDAATHFFFDTLPKGTYVFEYDLRANNGGDFSNGIANIQSMYAPEFNSQSDGSQIRIEN